MNAITNFTLIFGIWMRNWLIGKSARGVLPVSNVFLCGNKWDMNLNYEKGVITIQGKYIKVERAINRDSFIWETNAFQTVLLLNCLVS